MSQLIRDLMKMREMALQLRDEGKEVVMVHPKRGVLVKRASDQKIETHKIDGTIEEPS